MLLKAYGKHIDTAPIERIFTQGEKYSDVIKFSIPAVNNDIDISDCTFRMRTAVAGTTNTTETELEKQIEDGRLILSWSVSEYVTAVPGMLLLELVGTKGDAAIIKYKLPAVYVQEQILDGSLPEPDIIEQKIAEMNGILSQAQEKLDQAQSTAVTIDPTLTIEGQAADAKATGDKLGAMEEKLNELELLRQRVSALEISVEVIAPYIVKEYGSCGEETGYSICDDGTLHVTGANIDDSAFEHRDDFSGAEINIGGSVGVSAFGGCTDLNFINVNCTKICDRAFRGCPKLNSIAIGKSVTEIGSNIIASCAFYIPNGVRVMYAGTMAEWNAITKAADLVGEQTVVENGVVICTDGTVEV